MVQAETPAPPTKGRRRLRWLWWSGGALTLLVLGVVIVFTVSPRPGTRLIRYVFEKNAADV